MNNDKVTVTGKYGFLLGIYFALQFALSVVPKRTLTTVSFIMLLSIPFIIYYLICQYRDKQLNGLISFKNAFALSYGFYFVADVINALCQYIYFKYINTGFLSTTMEPFQQTFEQFGYPKDVIQNAIDIMTQPGYYVFSGLLVSCLILIPIISLIIAAFAQRKPAMFGTNQ